MKKLNIVLLGVLSGAMVACNSGSSSGGGQTTDTYTQLTPDGGVNVNNFISSDSASLVSESTTYYTTFGNNGNTLYAGTSDGQLLQMNEDYTAWTLATTSINNLPIVAIADNGKNGVYYAPYPSQIGYSYPNGSNFNVLTDGNLTAITSSSNGSIYYGTDLGNVGLTNNPASKEIPTIPDPQFGPILSIGCTGGSCNSGQQGVLVFQAESAIIPPFESTLFAESPTQYQYNSIMYYLNHSDWILAGYSNIISLSRSVTIESTTYTNVPEFVTTVTVNAKTSMAYAGTNFFNIYSAPLKCNNGQGCDVDWSSSPLNAAPLSTVTNGSQGISSIAVLPNGRLYVVANYSESVVGVYQSQSTDN